MSLFENQNSVNQFLTSTDGFEITLKEKIICILCFGK